MYYPRHIGIIPDGNRTWAKENGYVQSVGHLQGFNNVTNLVEYTFNNTDIEVFSVWGLSTENLKNRSDEELEYLFDLYKTIPQNLKNYLKENNINFKVIGSLEGLPQDLVDFLDQEQRELEFDSNKYIVLLLNYGGRDEIIRGVNQYYKDGNDIEDLTEEKLSKYLDFGTLPNIELLIRTKGDEAKRLSGFMLWWIGYAELYFSQYKFPEFSNDKLQEALDWFDKIKDKRNFGK